MSPVFILPTFVAKLYWFTAMTSCTLRQLKALFASELSSLYGSDESHRFVSMLIEHHGGWSRSRQLISQDEALPDDLVDTLSQAFDDLKRGRPVQQVIGQAWFLDRPFKVNPHVLIPRPETEELVDKILSFPLPPRPMLLDIGTGSGCIAISLKLALPQADVWAWDVSPHALSVARENAQMHQCNVNFKEVDVLTASGDDEVQRYDVVVSNPPYICDSEKALMHANVLSHEPHLALFVPDNDALRFYRAIGLLCLKILKPGGLLFFEINEAYGPQTVDLLMHMGYTRVELYPDLYGKHRMVKGEVG